MCELALFGVGGVAVPWLACWLELMDDETSSRYIFLFMLLLIPFLVIGLSIIKSKYIQLNQFSLGQRYRYILRYRYLSHP